MGGGEWARRGEAVRVGQVTRRQALTGVVLFTDSGLSAALLAPPMTSAPAGTEAAHHTTPASTLRRNIYATRARARASQSSALLPP